MIEDEFEGKGLLVVMFAVLGVPFTGEARIRAALVKKVRAAPTAGSKALQAAGWSVAWIAYLPAIVAYQAFAVPLVVGSVVLTTALVALAMLVGGPPVLVARALRRRTAA